MSLNEERMMILKMLQEGKISSDEAARLLEALDGGQKQTAGDTGYNRQRPQVNYQDEIAKLRERINDWKREFNKNRNNKDFDRMVDEFSQKAEKLGKNVANNAASFVDKLVDYVGSMVDTGSFNFFGGLNVVEKTYEAAAVEDMDLEVEGTNGQIVLKKHDDNRILIKSKIRCLQNNIGEVLAFQEGPSSVSLRLTKTDAITLSVSHEIFVPAVKFNKIRLETKNGKIHVEDSITQVLESYTKNASIDLAGVRSDKISVDTKNSKVFLNYVIGREVNVDTKNSIIEVRNLKVEKLGAYTVNGRIIIDNIQNCEGSADIAMDLKTKNGGIKVNMNDMENKGYKIKAQTTNGGINLLVPELLYRNDPKQYGSGKYAETESSNYSNAQVRVDINAETTNGYIEVVK